MAGVDAPRFQREGRLVKIHAALCVICGEPVKRQGEVVSPALYPYQMEGFHKSDRAHMRCAARVHTARLQANTDQEIKP